MRAAAGFLIAIPLVAIPLVAIPLIAFPLVAELQSPEEPPIFRSGTRLVEVQVIVRGQPVRPRGTRGFFASLLDSGPPFGPPGSQVQGLTKDDFTVLDEGKPQPIAFFRTGQSASPVSNKPLPVGVVSNRVDSFGQPSNNVTVILVDQLNTNPDLLAYERKGVAKMLRSLSATDNRVALYTMGRNLHILQDFTSDPQKLLAIAAKLDLPHGSPELAEAFKDYGGLLAWDILPDGSIIPDPLGIPARTEMTANNLRVVIQHLARVPGRKNLVWLMDSAPIPPGVAGLLMQTNIVLYPVLVRGTGCWSCPPEELEKEGGTAGIAAATGGRAFYDALDLPFALKTAEEDSRSSYVLGFYPTEAMLDGRYHRLVVKVKNTSFMLNYRPGYLATKLPPPVPVLNDQALLNAPLDSTGIGLTAKLVPDTAHPGMRKVELNVDLHDVHLEIKDGRVSGTFDILMLVQATNSLYTAKLTVSFPAEMMAKALESGYTLTTGGIDPEPAELRIVVRDPGTGAAGSLRVPVPKLDDSTASAAK